MKVLTEAAGSPVWPALFRYLRDAQMEVVATDIDPLSIGLYLADKAYLVPKGFGGDFFRKAEWIISKENIRLVIPSLTEGLLAWSQRKAFFQELGVIVVISEPEVISIFVDKWKTYQFFQKHGIPTPETSLEPRFDLIKPRTGRGGSGIQKRLSSDIDMTGNISQRYIEGKEYSIDVLCDLKGKPIYIVPRERLKIESGISFQGRVVQDEEIEHYVRQICSKVSFVGPINIQCIRAKEGLFFTEINPRISGTLVLSLAATTNWFVLIRGMLEGQPIIPEPTRYGMTMIRYYSEFFIMEGELMDADSGDTI